MNDRPSHSLKLDVMKDHLANIWERYDVELNYRRMVLNYILKLPAKQQERYYSLEINQCTQKTSHYFKIKQLNLIRKQIISKLLQKIRNSPTQIGLPLLDEVCRQMEHLRRINFEVAQQILEISKTYCIQSFEAQNLNYLLLLIDQLEIDNQQIKKSSLNKYFKFDNHFDPFFIVPYQEQLKNPVLITHKPLQQLFTISLSDAYQIIRTRDQIIDLKEKIEKLLFKAKVKDLPYSMFQDVRKSQIHKERLKSLSKSDIILEESAAKTEQKLDSFNAQHPYFFHSNSVMNEQIITKRQYKQYINLQKPYQSQQFIGKIKKNLSPDIVRSQSNRNDVPKSPSYGYRVLQVTSKLRNYSSKKSDFKAKIAVMTPEQNHYPLSSSISKAKAEPQVVRLPKLNYTKQQTPTPVARHSSFQQDGNLSLTPDGSRLQKFIGTIRNRTKIAKYAGTPIQPRQQSVIITRKQPVVNIPKQVELVYKKRTEDIVVLQSFESNLKRNIFMVESQSQTNQQKGQNNEFSCQTEPLKVETEQQRRYRKQLTLITCANEQLQLKFQTLIKNKNLDSQTNFNQNKFERQGQSSTNSHFNDNNDQKLTKKNYPTQIQLQFPVRNSIDQENQQNQLQGTLVNNTVESVNKVNKVQSFPIQYSAQKQSKVIERQETPIKSMSKQLPTTDIDNQSNMIKQLVDQPREEQIKQINNELSKPAQGQYPQSPNVIAKSDIEQSSEKQTSNSKKQIRARVGKASLDDVLLSLEKYQSYNKQIFNMQKLREFIKCHQTYLLQYLINDQVAVIALCSTLSNLSLSIKLWMPIQQTIDKTQSEILFSKYLEHLEKMSTGPAILYVGDQFSELKAGGFVKKEKYYQRDRKTKAKESKSEFSPFLSIQCSNIRFDQSNSQKLLYSEEIQQFAVTNSYCPNFISEACSIPTKFQNLFILEKQIKDFKSMNEILEQEEMDCYESSKVSASGINLMMFNFNTAFKCNFIAQNGYFKFVNSRIVYEKDNGLIAAVPMIQNNSVIYLAKGITIKEMLKILSQGNKSNKTASLCVKMFSKNLYGKMPNSVSQPQPQGVGVGASGCYGNWEINLNWEDEISGHIRHKVNEGKIFNKQFLFAVEVEQQILYATQVTQQDFLF